MRLLLDTHAFLWWVNDSPALSRRARTAIASERNECFLSHASCWEMAIKVANGKLTVPGETGRFIQEQLAVNRIRELPITLGHTVAAGALPFHHRDPFDRLLAAQALEEGLSMVSIDAIFRKYGVKRVW